MAILTEGEDPSKSPEAPLDTTLEATSAAAEEAAAMAADAANDLQKVEKLMGRQHLALYGFIGIFLAVLASAIAYLAGRQEPNRATAAPTKPPTVISSAVPSGAVAKPLPVVATQVAVPQQPQPVAAANPAPKPPPAPAAVAPATKPVEQVIAKPVMTTPTAGALADVLPNRLYLQVGSLDKNVAELLTQGLRTKGVPATVAPGVSDAVARIIVGPFDTNAEMGVVQKQLTELGFTPFPRQFQASELRPAAQNAAAVTPLSSSKPIVKR